MNKKIDLYYWPTPNGWKISIALEEMNLAYNTIPININTGEQFRRRFLEISPNNRVPAIVDPKGDDGELVTLFESGAILQYLANKTGLLYGKSQYDRLQVDQWLMWQIGGLGPMAGQAHHFIKYAPALEKPQILPYAQKRYIQEVGRLYRVLDKRLADRKYVAGNFFSIADIAIWPWASLWENQSQTIDNFKNLKRWLQECKNRKSVRTGRALLNDKRVNIQNDKIAQKVLFQNV